MCGSPSPTCAAATRGARPGLPRASSRSAAVAAPPARARPRTAARARASAVPRAPCRGEPRLRRARDRARPLDEAREGPRERAIAALRGHVAEQLVEPRGARRGLARSEQINAATPQRRACRPPTAFGGLRFVRELEE